VTMTQVVNADGGHAGLSWTVRTSDMLNGATHPSSSTDKPAMLPLARAQCRALVMAHGNRHNGRLGGDETAVVHCD
jgi:hypothetical protein